MRDGKIQICLAGCGSFGKRLAGLINGYDLAEIKYVYHPDPNRAKEYRDGCSDIEVIMNDPELDAFAIATPNDQHYQLLDKVMREARHHVFVEKPMTATAAEASLLVRWTGPMEANKKVLMIGHNQRREPVFRKAKEILASGAIGQVVNVNFNFSHGAAFNLKPTDWRYSADRHREGPLITLGTHCFDTLNYLFGRPERVMANILNLSKKTEAPDSAFVMMQLKNGGIVFLQTNYNVPSEKYCTISGTEGVIYINRNKISLRSGRDVNKIPSKPQEIPIEDMDTVADELRDFFDAILTGDTNVETGYLEGFNTMALLERCAKSEASMQYE